MINGPRCQFRTEFPDKVTIHLKLFRLAFFADELRKIIPGRKDNSRWQSLRRKTPKGAFLPFDLISEPDSFLRVLTKNGDRQPYRIEIIDPRMSGTGQNKWEEGGFRGEAAQEIPVLAQSALLDLIRREHVVQGD
jgi:hypothetical protein